MAGKLHEIKVSYFPRFYTVYGQQMPGQPLCDCTLNPGRPNPPSAPPESVSITGVASFGSAGLDNYFNTYPVQGIYTSTLFTDQACGKFGADWLYAPVNYERYDPIAGRLHLRIAAGISGGHLYAVHAVVRRAPNCRGPTTCSPPFVQDSWQPNCAPDDELWRAVRHRFSRQALAKRGAIRQDRLQQLRPAVRPLLRRDWPGRTFPK